MKKGVQGMKRAMVLMEGGVGYKPKSDVRVRKRVRGEKIAEDIVQINTAVTKKGAKGIEEIFGVPASKEGDEAPAGASPAEPKKEKKAGKEKK